MQNEGKVVVAFIDSTSTSGKSGQFSHYDYVLQAFLSVMSKKVEYEIINFNILGTDGEGSVEDLVQAIKDAERKGAKICNLSLSTYNDHKELKETIVNSDMLFIVAAGNESENLDEGFPSYPTNYRLRNVLSVAATDRSEKLLEISNYGGNTVDVAMNGFIACDDEIVEGTSIAAGKVTAVATMLYGISESTISAFKCKEVLVSLIVENKDLKGKVIAGGSISENYMQNIYELL